MPGRRACARSSATHPSRPATENGSASRPRSTTTSIRRRRSRSCTRGATTTYSAARWMCSGSQRSRRRRRRRPRSSSSRPGGRRRARPATSARPTGSAPRSPSSAGPCETSPTASSSCAPHVPRDQVYGRRPVREALRGRRQVLELWASERALAAEPWLAEAPLRVQVKHDRALSEAAGTRDHQGVLAWTEPYRYADAWELADQERPLLVCLDRVTDPRNLGAV